MPNLPGSPSSPLSPDAESFYKSQYQRYLKALEIFPESVQTNLRTGLTIARFNANAKDAFDPQFHQLSFLITDGQLKLLERGFEEVTREGDVVTFRGRYRNLPTDKPILADGSARTQTTTRDSIALIPNPGNAIRIQQKSEEELDPLAKGTPIGYECNCADYSGKQSLLKITQFGDINRQWAFLGSLGGCKHLLSTRLLLQDLPSVPRDLPTGILAGGKELGERQQIIAPKGVSGAKGIVRPRGIGKW